MTREEAIEMLSQCGWDGLPHGYTGGYREALDMAIKVLEEKQNIHDKCKRCVEFSEYEPLPEIGHWSRKTKVDTYDIEGVKTWGIKCQCDRCTFTTIVVEDFGYYSYCPNCGAKMYAESEDKQ